LGALIADFSPREVWTGVMPDSPEWRAVHDKAVAMGAKIVPLRAPGQFAFGGTAIEVLAPTPDYVPVDEPKNNDSLVMRVTFGQRSLLLSGDVERGIEQEMLYTNELRPTDVLKVAHHASPRSTEEFWSAVERAVAVISAGFENSSGPPHPTVVARLREHHAAVLRPDLDGMITIRTDGHKMQVETYSGLLGRK